MPDESEQTQEQPKGERAVASAGGRQPAAAAAGVPAVVVVPPPPRGIGAPRVSRRRVLQVGFWTGLLSLLGAGAYSLLNLLWPRGVTGFGSDVFVGTVDDVLPGKKLHNLEAKAWIVRFDSEQARRNGAQEGAILAIYHRCVHLGCTVPYRENYTFTDPRNGESYPGWFLCPCHGSTYSDAGVRVFGPAPRSLDTFKLNIDSGGNMIVSTGTIITGDETNGSRAILPG